MTPTINHDGELWIARHRSPEYGLIEISGDDLEQVSTAFDVLIAQLFLDDDNLGSRDCL